METSKLDRARRFVYSDLDLSFSKLPSTDDLAKKLDIQAVRQSVQNIVSTNRGEVPFRPDFGCNLRAYLFEPWSPFIQAGIEETIRFSLDAYEPRVLVQSIEVNDVPDSNSIRVSIEYTLKSPEPQTDVVSFLVERIR